MNLLDKSDKIKIHIRKDFLQYAHKKIDDVQLGDMSQEEYELFRQELLEIIELISDKDKYIEAMNYYKNNRNKNISKYFKDR